MKLTTVTLPLFGLFLAGCSVQSAQPRFQHIAGTGAALDTKTGQQCWTGPKPDTKDAFAEFVVDPTTGKTIAEQRKGLPYCADLKD